MGKMGVGAVHRFLIFDRSFACRLDRKWGNKAQSQTGSPSSATSSQLSDVETMQLIMGSTYSLKNMLKKLSPSTYDGSSSKFASPPASRRASATESAPTSPTEQSAEFKVPRETCFSFVTSKYRLIYYESSTGWKLVLLTDPGTPTAGELENLMRGLYKDIFVKHVIQNPAYRLSEPSFERPGLLLLLDEFVNSQAIKA